MVKSVKSAAAWFYCAGHSLLCREGDSTGGQFHSLGNPFWWANTCLTATVTPSPALSTGVNEHILSCFQAQPGRIMNADFTPHFVFSSQAKQNGFLKPFPQGPSLLSDRLPGVLWVSGHSRWLPALDTKLQCEEQGEARVVPGTQQQAPSKRSSWGLWGSNLSWENSHLCALVGSPL